MTIPQPSPTPPAAAVPPDAWLRAKELFAAVVALPPDKRAPLLDAGCGDDAALRQFVEALLRSNDALSTERSKTADLGLGPLVRRAIQQRWPQVERGRRFGAFAVVEEIATTLDAARADGEADEQRFLSPQTAAPEQFLGQPASVATDIYALGVLLCELCAGQRPFDGTDDREELRRRALHDAPRLPSHVATAVAAGLSASSGGSCRSDPECCLVELAAAVGDAAQTGSRAA